MGQQYPYSTGYEKSIMVGLHIYGAFASHTVGTVTSTVPTVRLLRLRKYRESVWMNIPIQTHVITNH